MSSETSSDGLKSPSLVFFPVGAAACGLAVSAADPAGGEAGDGTALPVVELTAPLGGGAVSGASAATAASVQPAAT